jgi:hypothetical protein
MSEKSRSSGTGGTRLKTEVKTPRSRHVHRRASSWRVDRNATLETRVAIVLDLHSRYRLVELEMDCTPKIRMNVIFGNTLPS